MNTHPRFVNTSAAWASILALALILAPSACKSKKEPAPEQKEPGRAHESPTATFDAAAPAPKKSKVDTAELRKSARKIVDLWLAAQNEGDFGAYSQLVGEPFTGVRRSGAKRVELDRAGWLRDRKRMFAKPTRIDISDVEIRLQASRAHVRFIQRWASGTYEDIGPKRLVIDLESKTILSEEMIASTIVMSLRTAARALGVAAENMTALVCQDLPGNAKRAVCLVDESNDELLAAYTLALLEKGPQSWTILDKHSGSVEVTEMDYGPSNTASVDSWLEAIAKGKYAIAVIADSESEGGWGPAVDDPGGHERRVETKWFAIEGDELREVLSVSGGGSSELDYSGEFVDVSVDVTEEVTNGYYRLELTNETTSWDGSEWSMHSPKLEESTSTLRWDSESLVYK